jgi:hypothetical protein
MGGVLHCVPAYFQLYSASMFSSLHYSNSEGGHFTLITVEEAVLQHVAAVHWST